MSSALVWSESGVWCRPRSTDACALVSYTAYELQSDLQMVVTCAGLGGTWERLNCELRAPALSAELGMLSNFLNLIN